MGPEDLQTAVEIVKARVAANGYEVLQASAVQKSRDSVLVTCEVNEGMNPRQAVVTVAEIRDSA